MADLKSRLLSERERKELECATFLCSITPSFHIQSDRVGAYFCKQCASALNDIHDRLADKKET